MKKINSCFIYLSILALVFNSCSSDETHSISNSITKSFAAKDGVLLANNELNPYDAAGRIHNEILDAYFEIMPLPNSVDDIIKRVDLIAVNNPGFVSLNDGLYSVISTTRVIEILDGHSVVVPTIFENAQISSRARNSLYGFTQPLLSLCQVERNYNVIYGFITDYESLVLKDTLLSQHDKKVMLTITSIARHSSSKKRRPRRNNDTDWETNIFHVTGALEGMSQGTANSITSALALGISDNTLQ